jgi:hypothetical protein
VKISCQDAGKKDGATEEDIIYIVVKKTKLIIGLTDIFEQKYTKLFFLCL